MSDEASSSAAAAHPFDDIQDGRPHDALPTAADLAKKRTRNRQLFNKKRGELLDDLLRSVDILVYAELSTIYYMDCSFIRLILRVLVQFVFLTPKPSMFPEPPPNRPYIGAILGTNLLCFILHAWFAAPSAGEATHGYLHGGLAIDFIGQKGPSSRVHLLLLDILVVMLQLVHLSAHITRQRLKEGLISVTTPSGRRYTPSAPTSRQDLDAEERGVRRSGEQQDIEMQTLNPSGAPVNAEDGVEDSAERETLLASTTARTDAHFFDAFNSGQIVLADLNVLHTLQEQFWAYQSAPRETGLSTVELRRNITGQLMRWRSGAAVGRPAQAI
ncbi:hypothetical protein LTR91_022614 [Friedmanniomyces endolithicus]|uniref:DUF1746 domain-containing protein n=1 Tax=Friedmanniomyces endolithicus TaxID=329885 RepID=A0AAN6JZ69_9PEZI|nr:hypothetical protein LTR94_019214 [Friedmanniomyces endolithicus]KAK0772252.1 hypothetical protein LTR59_015763 [Friedmanniomyces endolithicus]KAK0775527.1 hypothetical protein LTR38_015832 [Friedmanniomyces endolithicus]KAK0838003.1 hypothetical protein LTR03_012328 [Friedmanniomyces endolithicus]KAK0854212.1 hypothetical protein LTS02_011653 [Friedmanniomyces endolithicus]